MQAPTDGLLFDRIEKSFGGTKALKGVSLRVGRGEIVALLGENGAGKSTLIKVLGGIHRPDTGAVSIDGTPYAHEAGRSGGQRVAHRAMMRFAKAPMRLRVATNRPAAAPPWRYDQTPNSPRQ